MNRIIVIAGLAILTIGFFLQRGAGNKPPNAKNQMNPRYVILAKSADGLAVVAEGEIPRKRYDRLFDSDYMLAGMRIPFPDHSELKGALVTFGKENVHVLPIKKWDLADKTTKLLCQGTEFPGTAPKYSATEKQFDQLVKKIENELQSD